jgi:hypothetical protein
MAKLQNPVKQGFDKVTDDLKRVYAGHNKYGKALDRVRVRFWRMTWPALT